MKIDEITYASSTGANENGKSLQLINNEWKESAPTPGAANALDNNLVNAAAISAKFSFSPSEPKENEQITFDAASSTAGTGGISLYEWQFSDNIVATATEPVIIHSFSSAGIYTAQLTVYSSDNSSSTASAAINVVSATQEQTGANHIVISEIMPGFGTGYSDEEFIELYNSTAAAVDLSDYSLKRKSSATATSTQTLASSSVFSGKTIPVKGFLLVASNEYQGQKTPDKRYSSQSYHLAYDDDAVVLYNGDNVVDEVAYTNIGEGQSFERKSFSAGVCVSVLSGGEFLGNDCDTGNSVNDFEIRVIPNPQNSASLPEPRSAPSQIQNFNAVYNDAGPQLALSWNSAVDYSGATSTLVYKISDVSLNPTLSVIETTSTEIQISINEIGRIGKNNYKFLIRAFDSDDFGSASSTVSVDAPSFFSNFYFFKNPANQAEYFIEGYYDKYPFIPERFSNPNWKVAVFYLNQEAPAIPFFYSDGQYGQWGSSIPGAIGLIYKTCANYDTNNITALIFPDNVENCSPKFGGIRNSSFDWGNLEDAHFATKIDSSGAAFGENDFITVAFYADAGNDTQQLAAIDKNHYKFSPVIDWQKSPQWPNGTKLSVNSDKTTSKLNINWPRATDADSVDSLITYEIQYSTSSEWQIVSDNGHATGTGKIVAPGDDFQISVRAKDNFGNFDPNQILSAAWAYPSTTFYITQTVTSTWSMNFGDKNMICASIGCSGSASLQSITPKNDFQFNKAILRLLQSTVSDSSNLRLRVYYNNNGVPDLNNLLGETAVSSLYNPNPDSDITFSFNFPISVAANSIYWLYLDVSDPSGFFRNNWQNAISTANDYLEGDAGWVGSADTPQYTIPYPSGADWYMKIGFGLE